MTCLGQPVIQPWEEDRAGRDTSEADKEEKGTTSLKDRSFEKVRGEADTERRRTWGEESGDNDDNSDNSVTGDDGEKESE